MRGSHEAKMCDGAQSVNHFIGTVKECVKCGKEKPLDDFPKRTDTKNGYRNECRVCLSKINRLRYLSNAEEVKAKKREWNAKNKDKRREYALAWRLKNHPKKERPVVSREEKARRQNEAYMRWKAKNPDGVRECSRIASRKIRSTPRGTINDRMSAGIRQSLHGAKGRRKWETLVGYTIDELKIHLKKKFTAGMTWELLMAGEIHIDHKIPKTAFNFKSSDDIDFFKCWSLKNLQPMWAVENLKKHNNLERSFQPSLALAL